MVLQFRVGRGLWVIAGTCMRADHRTGLATVDEPYRNVAAPDFTAVPKLKFSTGSFEGLGVVVAKGVLGRKDVAMGVEEVDAVVHL